MVEFCKMGFYCLLNSHDSSLYYPSTTFLLPCITVGEVLFHTPEDKTVALNQVNTFCLLFTIILMNFKQYRLFLSIFFFLSFSFSPFFLGQPLIEEGKEQKHSVFVSDNTGRSDVPKCSRPAHFYIW